MYACSSPAPHSSILKLWSTQPTPLVTLNNPRSDQAFLAKNYDKNAWQADRDPHGIFRTPTDDFMLLATGLIVSLGSPLFSLATVELARGDEGHRPVGYPC